ncbi:MAG TPA: SMI1/KNR4 family protein [Ferruginibacter sp.]|nr:SMI1/KNR4 family protein [Ferruginibacter sp.]
MLQVILKNLITKNMIENTLNQITNWLIKNAPRIAAYSLNKPASTADLHNLSNLTVKQFPKDFLILYKTYNGINDDVNWGNFFYGMLFYSINDIIADQEFRTSQSKDIQSIPLKHFDPEINGTNLYNLNWIGLGSNGSRNSLRLDLSPAEQGTYGQIIFVDGDQLVAFVVADSITDLLNIFLKYLENGLYSLNSEALEDGQHFLDPNETIDLDNWPDIEKWKKYST